MRDHIFGRAHTKLLLYTSSELDLNLYIGAIWVPSGVCRVRFLQSDFSLRGSMSFGTKCTSPPRVFPSSSLKANAKAAASLRSCRGSAVTWRRVRRTRCLGWCGLANVTPNVWSDLLRRAFSAGGRCLVGSYVTRGHQVCRPGPRVYPP
jgi:hypothetical protein